MKDLIRILFAAFLASSVVYAYIKYYKEQANTIIAYSITSCITIIFVVVPIFIKEKEPKPVKNEVITHEIVVQSIKRGADFLILTDNENKEYVVGIDKSISSTNVSENDKLVISTITNDIGNSTTNIWHLANRQNIQETNKQQLENKEYNIGWKLHSDIKVSLIYQGNSNDATLSKIYTILEQKVSDLQGDKYFTRFEENWFAQFKNIFSNYSYYGNIVNYGNLCILPMSAIKELATLPKDQSGLGEFFQELHKITEPYFDESDFDKILLVFQFID